MKTESEIVAYLQGKKHGLFDFAADALVPYLGFAAARPWLVDEATEESWAADQRPLTREAVIADMGSYMGFAWEKAGDHRGLSAERSISRMQAWLWLLEDTELLAYATDDAHYPNYGAPILWRICEKYAFPLPTAPGLVRMAQGQRCTDGCDEGCG